MYAYLSFSHSEVRKRVGELLYTVLTCDLGDTLQGGYRKGEDNSLIGPHPQQPLTDQQAGDTNLT